MMSTTSTIMIYSKVVLLNPIVSDVISVNGY